MYLFLRRDFRIIREMYIENIKEINQKKWRILFWASIVMLKKKLLFMMELAKIFRNNSLSFREKKKLINKITQMI